MDTLPHSPSQGLRRRFRDALDRVQAAMGSSPSEPQAMTAPASSEASDAVEQALQQRLQELQLALRASRDGSEAKSRFLARLGHEIRTPMSGILGLCQLLEQTPLDETQRNYVELMQRSSGELLALLSDLLDFSRIEAGRLDLEPQAVHLRDLLDEAVASVHGPATEKGLLLECELAADLPPVVRADGARLQQACRHLLDNAVKFTAVGQVLLSARRAAEGGIVIEVSDTGPGMDPQLQARVFTPFVQGDESLARRHGGMGLGLTVVDTLVQAMEGRIELQSEPGRGATFRLHLPLPVLELGDPALAAEPRQRVALVSDVPASQQALAERLQHLNQDVVAALQWRDLAFEPEALLALQPQVVLYDQPPEGWPSEGMPLPGDLQAPWRVVAVQRKPAGAAPGLLLVRPLTDAALARALSGHQPATHAPAVVPPMARGRVLLVEDDEVNQVVARSFVEHLGHEADVAADAQAALEALQARDYALVLMDCELPEVDGLELTRRIRAGAAGPRAQRAPVVALTAHATAADRERCLAAGMDDYLTKPVEPAKLDAALRRWLGEGRP